MPFPWEVARRSTRDIEIWFNQDCCFVMIHHVILYRMFVWSIDIPWGGNRCTSPVMGAKNISDFHCSYVIMSPMASQITDVPIVYSIVCSAADQRKHQSSASLAFARGIHRWPVNSPRKGLVTRKMFPFDDVIMKSTWFAIRNLRPLIEALRHLVV